MITSEKQPKVRLAILSSMIAAFLANAGTLIAADPGSTRDATRPQAESKQSRSANDLHVYFGPWMSQQLVHFECGPTDILCIADHATYHNDEAVLRLHGNVLVDVRGKPTLYLGNQISVYPKTEVVVIEERASPPTIAMPVVQSERTAKAEKLWSEYKLDFLVRMTRRIDVLDLSDSRRRNVWARGSPGSIVRVVAAKTLFGNMEAWPPLKPGDGLVLYPETDAKKVMLVDYCGRQDRNWIPYDDLVEAKIVALTNRLKAP